MLARRPLLERRPLQNVIIAVALGIAIYMVVPPISPVLSRAQGIPFRHAKPTTVQTLSAGPLPKDFQPKKRPPPVKAKGIIMTGYTAGGSRFDDLVALIDRTELNAVVIDVKDERGEISWVPRSSQARMAGAGLPKIQDPAKMIRALHRKHIYVIGRIVTFQDPVLSQVRPDLAIRDMQGGGLWKNRKGLSWLDPYSVEAQDYVISLAVEAVELGFDEIQFDYIRFPTDGDTTRMWFPHKDERLPHSVIADFLHRARAQIVPRGAYISTDLFGLTALVSDDLGIGQKIELIAREVDYICLMLYPSHFHKPEYGIPDPEKDPSKIIMLSLRDANRRIKGTGAQLRPWLQDFTLRGGVPYTPVEVRKQIDAAHGQNVDQWLLWNANNRYTEDALRSTLRKPPDTTSSLVTR